ncbi:uncharacterized protein LDX57_010466 [Aspergillus melleus]|uniref:uncharacterized protein n=1 Tax=Aspergillus melleus TaxID=138277 RepID=UPI001E8E9568|nr:uncharacterized protein LDX57_010466 [Aspergillus melleus]KAH8432836.1 hypothetical protein LDX57_010466 [Aspergillus melleus]
MYSHMIFDLADRSYLRSVKSVSGATKYLDRITPKAIIVTDEGLTESKHEAVLDRIREYVKNGGMVIMGIFFPSFTPVDSFNKFFNQSFGLIWRAGDNFVSTDELNPICSLPGDATKHSFPASYTSKAVHIRDAQPHEIIMGPLSGAQTQSLVSSAGPGGESQAVVVGAKIGDGYLATSAMSVQKRKLCKLL